MRLRSEVAGLIGAEKRMPIIGEEFDRLKKEVVALHSAVFTLAEKLYPVRRQTLPQAESPKSVEEMPNVGLAAGLREASNGIRDIRNAVDEVIDTLEL